MEEVRDEAVWSVFGMKGWERKIEKWNRKGYILLVVLYIFLEVVKYKGAMSFSMP